MDQLKYCFLKAREVLCSNLQVFKESRFSPSTLIRHLTPFVAVALKNPKNEFCKPNE